MSLTESISDYLDFQTNKWKYEPDAQKYQQAKAAEANAAAIQAAKQAAAAEASKKAAEDAAAAAAAKQAVVDSQFSFSRFFSTFAWTAFIALFFLGGFTLIVYSGSLLANHGLGLPPLLRLVYFVYGGLFFFLYLPYYYAVEVGIRKHSTKITAILPLRETPYLWKISNLLLGWTVIGGVPATPVAQSNPLDIINAISGVLKK